MKKKIIENQLIDHISFGEDGDSQDIQDLITALIDLKKKSKKEGWRNIKVTSRLIDMDYPGVIMLRGDRDETDDEFEHRKKDAKRYKDYPTEELLNRLNKARKHGLTRVASTIKDELATREHVPNRIEKRVIRRLQSQTGISDVEELRIKHGTDIVRMVEEEQGGKNKGEIS